ncbi:MAG TPA: hypothetical protein VLA72_06700 [Anaerolineales bacterium]|nr:hypothetical protein [Anaerolineales bacterium]
MNLDEKLHQIRFLPLLVLAMLVTIFAQAVHETGHHLAYQVMGHEPVWAFTKVVQMSETTPLNPDEWTMKTYPDGGTNWLKVSSLPAGNTEEVIAALAGPLLGLFSATLGLVMSRRSVKVTSRQAWLTYTLSISLVAVLYYLRAPMRTGGDEYDIAVSLGITKFLVEIPLALGYLTCLVYGLLELPTLRIRLTRICTVLLGSIATGIPMAMLDPTIISQVDAGNPWFQPVFGYSLPVFLTIILTFVGIWVWASTQEGKYR